MIFIDESLANSLGLSENQTVNLSYGMRKCQVTVKYQSSVKDHSIYISTKTIESLLIDTKMTYQVHFKNNELIIGPVIGLLLGRTLKKVEKNLKHFLIYTLVYEQNYGVLFVFSEDSIDFEKREITGYIYDQNAPDQWRLERVPFPGAIFRRVEVSPKTFQALEDTMGSRFFNSKYFDKWQFWSWLSSFEETRNHLPETTNKLNLYSLDTYLTKYGGAILKPKSGSRGKGIYLIKESDGHYKYSKNYEEGWQHLSKGKMTEFLKKHKYSLLQQPIELQTYENRKVDYRIILQKSEHGTWQCTGMIARFGKENGIASNFKANGFAMEGSSALKLQFNYDERQAFQKYEEIVEVCIKVAEKLDLYGSYGDFGIDVGVDHEEKIWVIEVNKRQDHDFPLMIKDRKMYYEVKSNPILYSKYVALARSSDSFTHVKERDIK